MRRIFLFILLFPFLISCSPYSANGTFTVATWNMGTFFDSREDGGEYEGWKKSDGWNDEKYRQRVKKTVMYMASNLRDADLIILEEVESRDVLVSLLEEGLKREGYLYYGISSDEKDMSVAFISRIKPASVSFLFTPSSRAMINLTFLIEGEEICVIGVHLRSRIKEENDSVRMEELSFLRDEAEKCDVPLIILGDFNSDPIIHSHEMGRNYSAILPLTGDGSVSYGGTLFSPYIDYASPLEGGTYYYEGQWERLDNILLNSFFFDGEGMEYKESVIVKGAETSDYSGLPLKYDKSTGIGLSDHFALMARFVI